MRLYDGLPEPGPCEGCGFTTCRCKPASRPVPEPLSQVLRRLHEEATREATSTDQLAARARADRTTRDALPALADLVASVEQCTDLHCLRAGVWNGVARTACNCSHCTSLAALRERLEAK